MGRRFCNNGDNKCFFTRSEKMNNSEALILQGRGGDLKEWVDGINDMLTEIGILQNESRFEKGV